MLRAGVAADALVACERQRMLRTQLVFVLVCVIFAGFDRSTAYCVPLPRVRDTCWLPSAAAWVSSLADASSNGFQVSLFLLSWNSHANEGAIGGGGGTAGGACA